MVFDTLPSGVVGAGDILAYKIQTTSIPGVVIDPVKVPYRGVELNFAGRQTWPGTLECMILEVRDASTRKFFRSWMEFARNNNTDSGNYKNDYAKVVKLEMYDDIPNIVQVIEMHGMFPITVGDLALDGGTSTAGQLAVTFSYDYTIDLQ
jgi:hypothetical protein